AMRDALRRHDVILRDEIEARGGYVFKTIGDAFCAAFSTVATALEAAVAAQRRLGSEDFRSVDGLHVRMAIHAGETDERDGDYFGPALNRTARLLSAGHGGQILISGVAADFALAALPGGVTLRHLGELALRDLAEPERVYQPLGHELRSEFKPLRALETPPNNLPRQTTSFVGRHEDLAHVEALLDEGPLLTIVGAGGIGKTRLALEVAAARVNDEPDGAWIVDLSAITNAGLIAGTILTSIGGEPSAGGNPLEDLLRYLGTRKLLLLLDNSEHLVAEVSKIVSQVVARCPHVSLLATSREPLDISGERLYRLSTLDSESAMKLFADRARAADPAFRVEDNAAFVREICERLDGIALAIELAAARVRTISAEALLENLTLRLLSGGRDRRPRQQTMRALIDWSYDLLEAAQQRTLRRCAAFIRGFTLRAAAEVCGGDDRQMLEELASLADKSLVVAETADRYQRYRLLEPIREYALERLDEAGELHEVRGLHARTLASLARAGYEEWERGPGADWLARLEKDLPNFRVALRWTLEEANDLRLGAQIVAGITPVFLRLGLLAEGAQWCERVDRAAVELSLATQARLCYGLSMLYSGLGDEEKCLEAALLAAPLYRQARDDRGLARALSQIASRQAFQGRFDDAMPAADEALRLARSSSDRYLLADVLRRCAEALTPKGGESVRSRFQESVALFKSLGRSGDTARALAWWGYWEVRSGNYATAAELLREAVEIEESDAAVMFYSGDAASYYLAIGDRERANAFARKSLVAAAKVHHEILAALAVAYLAAVAADSDTSRAARLLGNAQQRLREAQWKLQEPDITTIGKLRVVLVGQLGESELARLLEEGAGWDEDRAAAYALS
ncbi:MAG TPA: NB-ARC domain-containing protein, partial [Candidatus Nitrosotalea sp.]|nr:NB-ARC domain-containing protein [Candidatus Nitrosotalea sp.]